MKRRPPGTEPGGLPSDLAAGPDVAVWLPAVGNGLRGRTPADAARTAWLAAGRRWSSLNGHGPNGWQRLLSPEVRAAVAVRARLNLSIPNNKENPQ